MEDLCETDQLNRNSKRGPLSCPEVGHPHGGGSSMASRTPGFFQAKKKLPTRAAPNRTRRTPSELKGSSAEADGSTLGAVAPREAESAREISLAQGAVRWASLQEEGKGGQVY